MAELADFRTRYPAFAAVADGTVEYWLTEGDAAVTAWPVANQDAGALAYAAHRLAEQGLGGAAVGGVTSFKSGTFSASVTEAAANRTGFSATVYGREYLALARRHFAGPRAVVTPTVSGL